ESGWRQAYAELQDTEKDLQARANEVKGSLKAPPRQRSNQPEPDNTFEQLKAEVDTLTREKATLKTEVETLGRETEKLGKTSADYDRLREEIKGKRDLLDGLSKELATLEIELREDVPRRATPLGEPFLERRDCKRQLMAAGGV